MFLAYIEDCILGKCIEVDGDEIEFLKREVEKKLGRELTDSEKEDIEQDMLFVYSENGVNKWSYSLGMTETVSEAENY